MRLVVVGVESIQTDDVEDDVETLDEVDMDDDVDTELVVKTLVLSWC